MTTTLIVNKNSRISSKGVHNRHYGKVFNVLLSAVLLFLIFVFYKSTRLTFENIQREQFCPPVDYVQIFKTHIFEYMYNKCIKNRLNRINDYIP